MSLQSSRRASTLIRRTRKGPATWTANSRQADTSSEARHRDRAARHRDDGHIRGDLRTWGRPQEALAVLDRPEFRESPYIAEAYARLGRRDEALRVLNGPVKREGLLAPQQMAIAYFALGDKERGFEVSRRWWRG